MTPLFKWTQADDVPSLRRDVLQLAQQLGELCVSKDLGDIAIDVVETPVAHGLGFPPRRWTACNVATLAMIKQTRSADAKYLFLVASTPVTAGIVVW